MFFQIPLNGKLCLDQTPDILALCQRNVDDSIDFGSISVRGHLLMQKDLVTHMHGLAVCVKEGLSFAWYLSLENYSVSYLCYWLALLHSVSYFFFLYRSPSLSLCTIYDTISSNINRFSQSSHLLIFLCLETLMSIARNVQPIVVEMIELVNSDLIISNDLTQMVHFATRIPDCDSVLFFLT